MTTKGRSLRNDTFKREMVQAINDNLDHGIYPEEAEDVIIEHSRMASLIKVRYRGEERHFLVTTKEIDPSVRPE